MAGYKMHKKRSALKITLLVLFILFLGAMAAATVLIRQRYVAYLRPLDSSGADIRKDIVIAPGSTATQVATQLETEGIIREDWVFMWYVRTEDLRDKIQAGTYRLGPSLSVEEITQIITEGKVKSELIRILPGKRLDQIKQLFMDQGYKEEEVDSAFDPARFASHPALVDKPVGASLEGYIYPDSYSKTDTTSAETIVRSSLDQMSKKLTPELRAEYAKQGLNVFQAVTIASVVEKEVSKNDDKPKVAQVFLKRYRIGMQLGSDVTAFYASAIAGKPEVQDITVDSPYNTRKYAGLPPGPISNVDENSLKAIARPANTDYLYFVAGDDGTTHYSNTLEEHEALARQYCTKLCGR